MLALEQLVRAFDYEGTEVFTSWDLGMSDSTALWLWTTVAGETRFLDYHEAHGKPLSYYFDWLDARAELHGYRYKKHWLPHDARARSLAAGTTVFDQCVAQWGKAHVEVVPKFSLLDGVQAARWLLQKPVRFHTRCTEGVDALKAYHYEYDDERRSFGTRPCAAMG